MKKIYVCEHHFYSGFKASTVEDMELTFAEYAKAKREYEFYYDDGTYSNYKLIKIKYIEDKPNNKHGRVFGRKPIDEIDKQKLIIRNLRWDFDSAYEQLKECYEIHNLKGLEEASKKHKKLYELLQKEKAKLEEMEKVLFETQKQEDCVLPF